MVMEAMRLSLLEHEEQQRREAEKKQKEGQTSEETQESTDDQSLSAAGSAALPQAIPSAAPTTIPSEVDPQNASQRSNRSGLAPSSISGAPHFSHSAGNSQTFLAPPGASGSSLDVRTPTPPASDLQTPLSVSPRSRARTPSPQPRRSGEAPSTG